MIGLVPAVVWKWVEETMEELKRSEAKTKDIFDHPCLWDEKKQIEGCKRCPYTKGRFCAKHAER